MPVFVCCLQAAFEQAFALGLASQAALVTGTIERMGPCTNSTFIAAQYSMALGATMAVNQTAAGLALAAAMNADLAGCAVAAASGLPLLEAGCSLTTLQVLASKPILTILTFLHTVYPTDACKSAMIPTLTVYAVCMPGDNLVCQCLQVSQNTL